MTMHTAEKIETIVDCFLRNGTVTGAFGTLVPLADGGYRVVADGLTVIVRTISVGWQVTFKGFAGIDAELYVAARHAIDAGRTRNVSTVAAALA